MLVTDMMQQKDVPELVEILRESLANGRQPQLTITSNSMSPLLRQGDQISLTHTPVSQLTPGDIISVEADQLILTHRFWYGDALKIFTRGDRPLHFDLPHPDERYIGRVIGRRRGHTYLSIENGLGYWLNKHLFWLAKLEKKIYNIPPPGTAPSPANHHQFWQEQSHRLFHLWARLLTTIVGNISHR